MAKTEQEKIAAQDLIKEQKITLEAEKEAAKAAKLAEKEAAKAALGSVKFLDRQALWEAFVKKYKKENPVKYEARKKELENIPDTFIG